jgi:hypothetical protein
MDSTSRADSPAASSAPPDFDRLGELMGDVCGGPSAPGPVSEARDDPARRLAAIWPDVVGAEVAANARPVQLKKGRLAVSASSSVWAQTLQFMGDAIAARLNERLGEGVVGQVVFRHAGWEERPRRRPNPRPGEARGQPIELSADQQQALALVAALDLPPELRARIARAMEAAFVRGEPDSVR